MGLTVVEVLAFVWFAVAVALLFGAACVYWRHSRLVRRLPSVDAQARRIMCEVKHELGCSRPVRVVKTNLVAVPQVMGFRRVVILLPDSTYDDDALKIILKHEWLHVMNKDLWLKLLLRLFVIVFWWNPLAYLLKAAVDQLLDIRCDRHMTEACSQAQKTFYLEVLEAIRRSAKRGRSVPFVSAELVARKPMTQRYSLIQQGFRPHKAAILCSAVLALFMLAASFAFLVQPRSKPDAADFPLYADGSYIFDATQVKDNGDGTYTLHMEDVRDSGK